MKKLLVIAVFIFGASAFAKEANITVKGMVCAYCSTGIEKTFKKQEAVDTVKVDLNSKIVHLGFKDGKDMTDAEIEKLITASGYNIAKIERK